MSSTNRFGRGVSMSLPTYLQLPEQVADIIKKQVILTIEETTIQNVDYELFISWELRKRTTPDATA